MTVKELINELKDYPQDALVVMSTDEEGNGHSPLDALNEEVYVADSDGRGQAYVARNLTPELKEQGYTEEDCYDEEDGQDAVVLWPTN
jgi:hypothetical protein